MHCAIIYPWLLFDVNLISTFELGALVRKCGGEAHNAEREAWMRAESDGFRATPPGVPAAGRQVVQD